MAQLILDLATKYPFILTALAALGTARLLMKPLMSFFHALVAITDSKKDDKFLAKLKANKIFKGFLYVLDYLFSIKVIK